MFLLVTFLKETGFISQRTNKSRFRCWRLKCLQIKQLHKVMEEEEDQCRIIAPSNGHMGDNRQCFLCFPRKVMELKNLLKFPMTENRSDRNFTFRGMVDGRIA